MLVMLAFGLAAVRVAGLAKEPMFAPRNFIFLQQIVNEQGVLGLRRYFTGIDFKWFGFHISGVILFFLASCRAILSMLNYAIVGNELLAGASSTQHHPRLIRVTARYGKPWRNVIFLSVLMLLANYLVSGQLFMWFEHELPGQLNHLLRAILHGRRGN